MKIIGIFLNKDIRTGANRRYLELMESLTESGNTVAVLMNSELDYVPRFFKRIDLEIKYRRTGFPPASYLFARAIRIHASALVDRLNEIGLREADWIHIHGDMHFLAALQLKKITGARIFFAFRCNDITRAQILRKYKACKPLEYFTSFLYNAKDRMREKSIAKSADLITFQNTPDRDIFLRRCGIANTSRKTVIIPGNIGLPRFTKETECTNKSTEVKNLLYVGTVSYSKGLYILLETMAMLKKRGYGYLHLSVLGKYSGKEKAFRLVKTLGIEKMVAFEGYVAPFSFLQKADLMVYPTLYDAFPDAILEALHTGCPVIASNIGGIPEILQFQELLFDLASPEQIADRIERCIKDTYFYLEIRKKCQSRIEAFKFDWAKRFEQAMIKGNDTLSIM